MNPSTELASFASCISFDQIPDEVINRARQIIIDTIGCAVGGYTVAREECRWIINFVKEAGGNPEAKVWVDGFRTSGYNAALANGVMIHTIDFDDTHVGSIAHLGASLVPVIIALGEKRGASGTQAMAAFIAGFEVADRVGKSINPSHYKYWHPTATLGSIGAAVAAARLMGFNAEQMEQAIGLAADQAAGFRYCIDQGDYSKSLHPGWAAMRGIMAAAIIALGANGPKGLLEYETGLCRAMSEAPDLTRLTAGLGKEYEILQDAIKLYPTIHCSHTSIEGMLEIVYEKELKPEDLEVVQVRMTELPKGQGMNYNPATPLAARLSIPFCLAAAVVKKQVTIDEFTEEELKNPLIREIMSKVEITPDGEFNKKYPGTFVGLVNVRTRGGEQYEKFVIYPKGHPNRPASDIDICEKFSLLALRTWPQEKVKRSLDVLSGFEKLGSIKELADVL